MRRPVWALYALVVGLAVHNLVMAALWRAGVRGTALSVVAAWKDVLLVLALALVVWARRALPVDRRPTDLLALAFGVLVVVYGLIPQAWLDGGATHKGVLYAARHDLLPVGAYFLGRGLHLTQKERATLVHLVLAVALVVAAFGLVDVYAVPLSFWRPFAGWFSDQLGLTYRGLSGLPENFVYNAGNGEVFRRLTSTFLSPLATSYLLLVALLFVRRWWLAVPLFAALLFTHSRSALVALAAALVVLALVRRAWRPALLALGVVVAGFIFVKGYDHFAPRTHFTQAELRFQQQHARQHPGTSHDPTSASEASTSEHLSSLRDGARTVVHHPWGFGLGNSGVTAERTKVDVKAGESTYTELGVETGLLGALAFVAWSLALLRSTLRRRVLVGAAFAGVLVLGLQTDVIGVPWIAVSVWSLAGDST
jgi:O-antigen ligase